MPRQPGEIDSASFRLLLARGIGPATRRKLLDHFGSAEAAVSASILALADIPGVGRRPAAALREAIERAEVERERAAMDQHGVALITREDDDYPPLLRKIPDPPGALWIRGALRPDDAISMAIVGSRRCTAYGREQSARFAGLLAQSGFTIISGGALGVDGEAHRAARRSGGRTVAVLGSGLARPYPREHESLFDALAAEDGAVISEHPMHAEPVAANFPRRNRIIAGLALGVLVIEAAERSGALITARLAAEDHGREVMAVPGRVDSPASAGSLKLIRDGGAAMVLDHGDVIAQIESATHLLKAANVATGLLPDGAPVPPAAAESGVGPEPAVDPVREHNLTDGQRAVLRALRERSASDEPVLLDQLVEATQLPVSRIMPELTLLQLRGLVRRDHRGVMLVRRESRRR